MHTDTQQVGERSSLQGEEAVRVSVALPHEQTSDHAIGKEPVRVQQEGKEQEGEGTGFGRTGWRATEGGSEEKRENERV